ncbi:hypothetical protein [Terrabacter terrae]
MTTGATVAAIALLLGGSALSAGATTGQASAQQSAQDGTMTFHVQFSPFNYTDLGAPGPSAADVIVFHDRLQQSGKTVGDEVGSCVLVDKQGLANCTGVVRLGNRGTITYAFVNSPPPHKVLAVTGGSGQFRAVDGDGTLDENGDGTGTLVLRPQD